MKVNKHINAILCKILKKILIIAFPLYPEAPEDKKNKQTSQTSNHRQFGAIQRKRQQLSFASI